MRVLHVISGIDPENGGPTFALVALAEAQVRAGLDVTVIATWQIKSGFPLADRMRAAGVKVNHIGPARGKLSTYPGLAGIVDDAVAKTDVVHVHALWEQIQHDAARSAMRRGVPYVITPHGMLAPWSRAQGSFVNRWGKRLYLMLRLRRNMNNASALHFTTTTERDLAAPLGLRPPVIIEPIGLERSEFEPLPLRGGFRADRPEIAQKPMVLFLSRISPQKGLDRLIPAFAQMLRKAPSDAVLVIAGPDYENYSATVKSLIDRHDVRDRVIFTGMLNGVRRIEALVDADLFVLPSHHENFGMVVAEAMAAGAPVVVSREVNIHSDVTESGGGAVVSGDVDELANEMARWLANPALRRDAGARGRAFALAKYNWDEIARHWVDHYARLAERAR